MMNSYTFGISRMKKIRGKALHKLSNFFRALSSVLVCSARHSYRLSKNISKNALKLEEEANGTSFRIDKGVLLDRRMARLTIITLHENRSYDKNKYFYYFRGAFEGTYIENKGKEFSINDSHYYMAANGHAEWELIE